MAAPTLVVVGAGMIGRRHLEALAQLDRPAEIVAVDPSETARAEAAAFASTAAGVSELPREIDVAVVATTAAHRLDALRALLDHASVRFVILEKFLFQTFAEYDEAEALLAATGTEAWVNCPRRAWPSYHEVAEAFRGDEGISCAVTACARHGVASNAIHFVDLVAMLTGESHFEFRTDLLELSEAKRAGNVEFEGTLYGIGPAGGPSRVEYTAHTEGTFPVLVALSSARRAYVIRELESRAWVASEEGGWAWAEQEFPLVLQSRLTNLLAERLLDEGRCDLPTYAESAVLHRDMLGAFLGKLGEVEGTDVERCPIT